MNLTLLVLLVISWATISVGAALTEEQIIRKELAWIRSKADHYKNGFRADHPARIIDDTLLLDHQLLARREEESVTRTNLRGA